MIQRIHSTSAESTLRWKALPPFSPTFYKDLTKAKLSAFVVLTTMAGYAVAPGLLSLPTLLWTTAGTGLCVASANAINQWIEGAFFRSGFLSKVPFDAQMSRTKNRVLVRHALTPAHAFGAGILSGVAGVSTLYTLVNPLTALLGGANILI